MGVSISFHRDAVLAGSGFLVIVLSPFLTVFRIDPFSPSSHFSIAVLSAADREKARVQDREMEKAEKSVQML